MPIGWITFSTIYNKKPNHLISITIYHSNTLFQNKLLHTYYYSYIQTPFCYYKYQNDVYLH